MWKLTSSPAPRVLPAAKMKLAPSPPRPVLADGVVIAGTVGGAVAFDPMRVEPDTVYVMPAAGLLTLDPFGGSLLDFVVDFVLVTSGVATMAANNQKS